MPSTTERFSSAPAPEAAAENPFAPHREVKTPTTEELEAIVEGPVRPKSGLHRVADIISKLAETHDHARALRAARNDQDTHADVTDSLVASATAGNEFSGALLAHEERVADLYDGAHRLKDTVQERISDTAKDAKELAEKANKRARGILRGIGAGTRSALAAAGKGVSSAALIAAGAGVVAGRATAEGVKTGVENVKAGAEKARDAFDEASETMVLGAEGFKEDIAKAAGYTAERATKAATYVAERTTQAANYVAERATAVKDATIEKTLYGAATAGVAIEDAGKAIVERKDALVGSFNEKREAIKSFWQKRKNAALERKAARQAAREKRHEIRERAQNVHAIQQERAAEVPQAENTIEAVEYKSPVDDIIANGPEPLDTSSPAYQEKLRALSDDLAIAESQDALKTSTEAYRKTIQDIMGEVDNATPDVTEQPAKAERSRDDSRRKYRHLGRRAAVAFFRTRNKARSAAQGAKEGWNNG